MIGDMTATRAEHLEWCKKRALQYLDSGDIQNAWASMESDLNEHEETRNHSAIKLGMMMLIGGHFNDPQRLREFINGFH